MKKSIKTGILAAISTVAAAIAVTVPTASTAKADDLNTAVLSPVAASSETVYHYFENPTAVTADASGITVANGSEVVTVKSDKTFESGSGMPSEKAFKYRGGYVTLKDGVLSLYCGGTTPSTYSPFFISDIDVYNDAVYAVGGNSLAVVPFSVDEGNVNVSFDLDGANVVTLESDAIGATDVEATAVTVSSENIYVAVDSDAFDNKQAVASANAQTGELSTVLYRTDKVMSMTVMPHSGAVYVLTRDRITGYLLSGSGLRPKYSAYDDGLTSIYAYDGFVYALNSLDGLEKISADLTSREELAVSASEAIGFLDTPSGATVKNSALFVADTANDRIVKYSDAVSIVDGDFYNPVSVASDSGGTLYVAHDFDKISVGGNDIKIDGVISQIAVNADKRLFAVTNTGLWTVKGGAPEKISDTRYKSIALGVGHDDLYALADSEIVKFTQTDDGFAQEKFCDAPISAFSFAVDFKNNVYFLSRDRITRMDSATKSASEHYLYLDGEPYLLGRDYGQILLSTVDNEFIDYESAVVVDTFKHRVFSVDGTESGLNIKLIDEQEFEVPEIVDDKTPARFDSGLIRTALYDTPVFSLPIETPEKYVIKRGWNVIVPEYDLADAREYSFILIDDRDKHELIQGYVYKDALSDPLPYSAPPASSIAAYSEATPIYKWPSPHSETLSGYSPAKPNDDYTVLSFVESFRDYRNNLWYRVSVGGIYEGYMMGSDVVSGEYEISTIRPAYNAKIISYKGSTFAPTYSLDGKYKTLDIVLPTGTKVEVVGTFDTSERYTKIKCLTEQGTVTCYVETVYLEYDGVNIVLIVAIIVIIITVILAAIIIGRVVYVKKKRLEARDDEDELD